MRAINYELKYCERCGSLRVRRADSMDTYCPSCERLLFNVMLPNEALRAKLLLRRPRAPKPGPALHEERQLALTGRLQ